jgi:hypothetical protein
MSAAEVIKVARDAGIELAIDGDDLVLEGPARPPATLLDLLSRHKAGRAIAQPEPASGRGAG